MNTILQPWPWYVSGPLIALIMFILIMVGKKFGMSSNLQTLCSIGGLGKKYSYFKIDWKKNKWNLIVVLGAIIGGYIAAQFLSPNDTVVLHDDVVQNLSALGFESAGSGYMPIELFDNTVFTNPKSIIILLLGGIFVGFGARYADGCTSGHAISGLSNFQLPSLIAVIGFFIGGLLMVHLLFPIIF